MGGYPNYTLLAKTAGIKTGFVGKDAADGQAVDFKVEILNLPLPRVHPSAGHPGGGGDL